MSLKDYAPKDFIITRKVILGLYFISTDSSSKFGLFAEPFTLYVSTCCSVHIAVVLIAVLPKISVLWTPVIWWACLHINFIIVYCEHNIMKSKFGDLSVVKGKDLVKWRIILAKWSEKFIVTCSCLFMRCLRLELNIADRSSYQNSA